MNAGDWDEFRRDSAEYAKTQNYRDYQAYVEDFKATQEAKNTGQKAGAQGSPTAMQSPALQAEASFRPYEPPHNPAQQAGPQGRQGPKMPIKRLRMEEEARSSRSSSRLARAKQACEVCRRRKIKCYGEQPTCRNCKESATVCTYESGSNQAKKM